MPALRSYQRKALAAIDLEIGLGAGPYRERAYRRSTLVDHATGTGKSAIIGCAARVHLRRGGRRVLVTAPRAELLYQDAGWVERWGITEGEIGWELAEQRSHKGHRVIMASLASLRDDRRLEALPDCDLWLVDEGHLEPIAQRRIWERQEKAAKVGFTATPDRADLLPLFPQLFEAVHPDAIYEIGDAIDDEWLAPIQGCRVDLPELSGLASIPLGGGGDFQDEPLSKLLRKPAVVDKSVAAVLKHSGDRPTLVFCTDLAHAAAALARFEKWAPGQARIASGELSRGERREVLADFQAGEYRFILTVALLTYGWDAPLAACAAMLRPTRSRALWTQSVGRVLRPHASKPYALVLDFWGGSEDLTLVTPADALTPRLTDLPEGTRRRVEGHDLAEILQEEAHANETLPPPAKPPPDDWRVSEIETLLGVVGLEVPAREKWAVRATHGQCAALRRYGIEHAEALSIDQASELLDQLAARRARGLCTLNQARTLQRKGLNPNVEFEIANKALDRIASNGWRVPADVRLWPELSIRGGSPMVGDYSG